MDLTYKYGHRSPLAGPYRPGNYTDHRRFVKKIIPTWTDGLHPVQLELVSAILDGQDIFCCTATGDVKSAALAVPGLFLLEYNARPDGYPGGLPTRKRPIGLVITPSKGLANNMAHFLPFSHVARSSLSRFSNRQN